MKIHPTLQQAFDSGRIPVAVGIKLLNMEWKEFTLNLQHCDYSTWSKRMWQICFNVYMQFHCPLGEMHDMLCDYDNIKRVLEEVTLDSTIEFYWYFDPGFNTTVFDIREHWGEEFGIHFKQTEDGKFPVRYLLSLRQSEDDSANPPRDTELQAE
jgi:hypothetical protein